MDDTPVQQPTQWTLYVDGASRGNPGPAGAGIYIKRTQEVFLKQGYFLGIATNNQAEYMALLLGLCHIKPHLGSSDTVRIMSDSELLVRQVSGRYAIKHSILKSLHQRIMQYLQYLTYDITHVVRAQNSIADGLANEGIDQKKAIPDELRSLCALPLPQDNHAS